MEVEKNVDYNKNINEDKTILKSEKYSEKKNESSSSSSSDSYMFQVNEEKDFVIFEKKHISDFSDLK